MGLIHRAGATDVKAIVELAELRRVQYEKYQPVFWRKAADSQAKQLPYFHELIKRRNVIALVHEESRGVDGFIIGELHKAPPVYDPRGLTCSVDDFVVSDAALWEKVGASLLDALVQEARERGAVQIVVVCGHLDELKRAMLQKRGMSIASEWYVKVV